MARAENRSRGGGTPATTQRIVDVAPVRDGRVEQRDALRRELQHGALVVLDVPRYCQTGWLDSRLKRFSIRSTTRSSRLFSMPVQSSRRAASARARVTARTVPRPGPDVASALRSSSSV